MPLLRVRALLLDLDGTLIDSADDLAAAANVLRGELALAPLEVSEVRRHIGWGAGSLVRGVIGPDHAGRAEEALARFREIYLAGCLERTRPLDGVPDALAALAARGLRLAVVTNKPERPTRRIVEGLGLGPFDALIGGDTCPSKKPDPGPLVEACRRMEVALAEVAMVGDSVVDVEAARRAGVPAVGVRGGIGDEGAMLAAGPDAVLARFSDLLAWVEGA